MGKSLKYLLLAALVLLLAFAAGCGSESKNSDEPADVRIAYFPNITHNFFEDFL